MDPDWEGPDWEGVVVEASGSDAREAGNSPDEPDPPRPETELLLPGPEPVLEEEPMAEAEPVP